MPSYSVSPELIFPHLAFTGLPCANLPSETKFVPLTPSLPRRRQYLLSRTDKSFGASRGGSPCLRQYLILIACPSLTSTAIQNLRIVDKYSVVPPTTCEFLSYLNLRLPP
jgi:hypothetical protein